MADDKRPPFGHPDFYAPIWDMLRDAANDADCHAYTDELLFAADEIERLRSALEVAADRMSMTGAPQAIIDAMRKAARSK